MNSENDIVTRLRGGDEKKSPASCWHCDEWGCENADEQPTGCSCEDSCDCDNNCICDCHEWFGIVGEAADEIERLRSALQVAAGLLSTYLPEHPLEVLGYLMEEARNV